MWRKWSQSEATDFVLNKTFLAKDGIGGSDMYRNILELTGLRAVPEIILGGAHFCFRPLHPQDTHGVRAPRPPGHVSALINPPYYRSNMPWPPGEVTPHPTPPLGHTVNKTPSPHRTKKCLHPPEDNFWSSPQYKRHNWGTPHQQCGIQHPKRSSTGWMYQWAPNWICQGQLSPLWGHCATALKHTWWPPNYVPYSYTYDEELPSV